MPKQYAPPNNIKKEGLGFDGLPQKRLKIKSLTKEKLTTKKEEDLVQVEEQPSSKA